MEVAGGGAAGGGAPPVPAGPLKEHHVPAFLYVCMQKGAKDDLYDPGGPSPFFTKAKARGYKLCREKL